jgi:hypothetical protein
VAFVDKGGTDEVVTADFSFNPLDLLICDDATESGEKYRMTLPSASDCQRLSFLHLLGPTTTPRQNARVISFRRVFVMRGIDRIMSAVFVKALVEEIEDSLWVEWRGSRGDRPPHKLTEAELALLLRPFQIKPRTIWPTPRRRETKSAKGYLRASFEDAWRRYCRTDDRLPAHRVQRSA